MVNVYLIFLATLITLVSIVVKPSITIWFLSLQLEVNVLHALKSITVSNVVSLIQLIVLSVRLVSMLIQVVLAQLALLTATPVYLLVLALHVIQDSLFTNQVVVTDNVMLVKVLVQLVYKHLELVSHVKVDSQEKVGCVLMTLILLSASKFLLTLQQFLEISTISPVECHQSSMPTMIVPWLPSKTSLKQMESPLFMDTFLLIKIMTSKHLAMDFFQEYLVLSILLQTFKLEILKSMVLHQDWIHLLILRVT